ncbi:MAG: hypothetical protein AAFY26_25760 [Cyanobacteria bacterium J06638_22]
MKTYNRMLRALKIVLPVFNSELADEMLPEKRIQHMHSSSLLLIYGESDTSTPVTMGQRMLAACGLPTYQKSIWTVPGADHNHAMRTAPKDYEIHVIGHLLDAFKTDAR